MTHIPDPLEWHPAYRDETWLIDWLERRGPYGGYRHLRLPRLAQPPTYTVGADELHPDMDTLRITILTREKCWRPAPYVGRPFRYVWPVGIDQLGRCIAGEARIVYEIDYWLWQAMYEEAP